MNRNSIENTIELNKLNLNLSYIQLKNFASIRHQDTEQINYRFNFRINKNWNFTFSQLRDLAGAKYSLPIKTNIGISFSNECIILQLGYLRDKSYDIDIPSESNLNFNIKLFGF